MRPLRVLHLEDSLDDAEIVRHRIDAGGLTCTIVVANGRDSFVAALAREPYDLIICDYNVPGYDGVSALQQAQATQPDVPVILVSGVVVEEQAVKCLQIGATDYLLKSRLERLVPAVKRAIQEADTRRTKKRVEAALGESESRKAAILDSVLDCIVTMDSDGTVIEFNAAAVRTFGYTKAEAVGRPLADLIIPIRFRARHRAGLARYLATGESTLIGKLVEMSALRSDGSEIPVELTITSIRSGATPIFTGVLRDITARRHADTTRARLAAIVDSSDDSILSMALDTTILTWNAGAERLYGYRATEMVGHSAACLVPAGKSAEVTSLMERAARGETGELLETQRTRKDGSAVEISLVTSPITDPDGRITGVSTIARDITGRKRAEAELKRISDRAQRYLDTAEVILLSLDLRGRITMVNRYGCSLLGWSEDELIGRDFIETCVPARIRDQTRKKLANVLNGPDSSIVENAIVTRSGGERLVEWRNTLLRDDDGCVVSTLSSGTDITERTAAAEALRQAEERMRFALQHAKVGIWDMDFTTGVLQWSEVLESLYGLKPGTFDQTFEGFIERIHPADRAAALDTIGKAMTSGTDFVTLHRTMWADGTVRWLSGAGRALLGEDGQPVRAVGISQDITETRSLQEQYQQAQKMEAIGRLAAGVAHDFNNLLTVILGFCELLLPDLDKADPHHADVTEIQKAGTRAVGLTRQLLAFSRKEIIEPRLLDLNAIVAGIRVLLERLIGEDVKVVLCADDALAPVMCDRGQVEQIVLNLAVNARDAMPKGGTLTIATANVEFGANGSAHAGVKAGRYVALCVTDTGTGMTPEVQARLFEPFFTTKGIGKGTGLGLATVHGIVARCDGSFHIDSELGRGTSFTVYFPRADISEPIVAAPSAETRPRASGQTILVVEDEPGLREVTRRLLVRQGYTVLVAANAEEAQQLFDAHQSIDLLLTDVVMPDTSGPDLVMLLVERRPGLKVIYMSGYTDDAIVHHGVLDPGIAFLPKPFSSETLGRKLREVLDQ